jgi:hypothetical protein
MGCGSGGRSVMPPFYRLDGPVATMALERLRSVAVVMLGLPQLTFTLIGGSLSRRFRITITRR